MAGKFDIRPIDPRKLEITSKTIGNLYQGKLKPPRPFRLKERTLLTASTQFPNHELSSPIRSLAPDARPLGKIGYLIRSSRPRARSPHGGGDRIRLDRDPRRRVHRGGALGPGPIGRAEMVTPSVARRHAALPHAELSKIRGGSSLRRPAQTPRRLIPRGGGRRVFAHRAGRRDGRSASVAPQGNRCVPPRRRSASRRGSLSRDH